LTPNTVVIETAALSEIELSEYCRRKGLYPQQVKAWKSACLTGQQSAKVQSQADRAQTKADRKRIRQLERELNRKEKALAEAAALLVLRKKLNAYWGDDSEAELCRMAHGSHDSGCAQEAGL